jgi:hypothetical protein
VEGVLHPHREVSGREFVVSYVVLGVAFLLEGSSLAKALRQLNGEARMLRRGLLEQLRRSNDPTVKTVASEDSAAVAGLLLAAAGLVLHQLTGSGVFDAAAASMAIGLLLAWIAYALGRDTKELLIGESADPELLLDIMALLIGYDGVTRARAGWRIAADAGVARGAGRRDWQGDQSGPPASPLATVYTTGARPAATCCLPR